MITRLFCSAFVLLLFGASARAATITFDALAQPGRGVSVIGPSYTESGFTFSADLLVSTQTGSQDFTGTGTLVSTNSTFTLTASDASAFDLNAITLWELNRGLNTSFSVTLIGAFVGGGSIAQHVQLDGTFDADAFTFIGFKNLASLQIRPASTITEIYQIDTLDVSRVSTAVPEPTSLLLLGTGALVMGLRRLRP